MTTKPNTQLNQALETQRAEATETAIAGEATALTLDFDTLKQGVSSIRSVMLAEQQRNYALLEHVRQRKHKFAALRATLDDLDRQNGQFEIELVSALRAGVYQQASLDADDLIVGITGRPGVSS